MAWRLVAHRVCNVRADVAAAPVVAGARGFGGEAAIAAQAPDTYRLQRAAAIVAPRGSASHRARATVVVEAAT